MTSSRWVFAAAVLASGAAFAQTEPLPDAPPPPKKTIVVPLPPDQPTPPPPLVVPQKPADPQAQQGQEGEAPPLVAPPPAEHEATPPPPPEPPPSYEPPVSEPPPGQPAPEEAEPTPDDRTLLDGHKRMHPFWAGPGSLTFVLHHTIMLGLGGLATQVASSQTGFTSLQFRENALAGLLIGAGLGFGASSWWQFNHWIDQPMASYGIVNSVISGMFFAGLLDLMTNDTVALTWTALLGAELGAWLTATLGGGEMPMNKGLLIASGGGWGLIYAALLLAIIGTSGGGSNINAAIDTLLVAPGVGAGLMALASMKYNPTTTQVLRADVFGAGVGGAVLLLAALVLGNFQIATPYVLALLSSAGAIATVSLLWEEAAEEPAPAPAANGRRERPYRNVWW